MFCICASISIIYFGGSAEQVFYDEKCYQPDPFIPTKNIELDERLNGHLSSPQFQSLLATRLGGAIQIPTISFDSMRGGPTKSDSVDIELHKPFEAFHRYLESSYPLIHERLEKTVINKYSLLFRWGELRMDPKPIMLMAHMDVVPVDEATADKWTHPPFSAHFDGERVWGRGSVDTKLSLISIVEAVEALLESNFTPNRTIFLAFGPDEEISGYNGAQMITKFLQSKYEIGKGGLEMILDEGPTLALLNDEIVANNESNGVKSFAMVGISEKGYMDLNITVTMNNGGHSSLPPPHTTIGIISEIITTIENCPPKADLYANNPLLGSLMCLSAHSNLLSARQKFWLEHFERFKPFILTELRSYPILDAFVKTTQAADIIHGGIKVNAIPTFAYALFNMRIALHESVESVSKRITALITPIAKKHNLELTNQVNIHPHEDYNGSIHLSFDGLEPSPITSTETFAYNRLSAVIRRVFGHDTIVTPFMMTANTDTRWSWEIGESIFRFNAFIKDEGSAKVHTVDENCSISAAVSFVKFYHELIRGFNE